MPPACIDNSSGLYLICARRGQKVTAPAVPTPGQVSGAVGHGGLTDAVTRRPESEQYRVWLGTLQNASVIYDTNYKD